MQSLFKSRNKPCSTKNPAHSQSLGSSSNSKTSHQHHFTRKPTSSHQSDSQPKPFSQSQSPSQQQQQQQPQQHIDEFGNPIANPLPAFTLASQRYHKPIGKEAAAHEEDVQYALLYGYTGLSTQLEINSQTTCQAVKVIADQLKSRPLDSPLIFSTYALDISVDGSHSLIRSFVHHHQEFMRDIQISSPHNLSAFLKWILARHTSRKSHHGILDWKTYLLWRSAEADCQYPPNSISSHLFAVLPSTTSFLLKTLFDLFSTVAAYSHLNGMTIHKCGAIFGAFIFGLEDDLPFEQTYSNWLRYAHATEHMLLAFLRDQKSTSPTKQLPSRLESCIRSYTKVIPSLTTTDPSARLECVARFRRYTRFYNKNLIQNAGQWNVPKSKTWARLQPSSDHQQQSTVNNNLSSSTSSSETTTSASKLILTKSYKHLLNIGTDFAESDHHEEDSSEIGRLPNEIDLETQKFKTLVEKQWSGFINNGFQSSNTTNKKLEFDLNESERTKRRERHQTMDWDSFAGSGFAGRETFTPTELQFDSDLSTTVKRWPVEQKALTKKLYKVNKALPAFEKDCTPTELEPLLVDENFFEAWADALVASGWSRDELKQVSWALVHYKCRPANHHQSSSPLSGLLLTGDRSDDMWVLFEEVVPAEYRELLIASGSKAQKRSRRISFLRVITTRPNKHINNVPPHSPSDSPKTFNLTHQGPFQPAHTFHTGVAPPIHGSGGFMAEFRAKARKRHQNYQLPADAAGASHTIGGSSGSGFFAHTTWSTSDRSDWLDVLPKEKQYQADNQPDHHQPQQQHQQQRRVKNQASSEWFNVLVEDVEPEDHSVHSRLFPPDRPGNPSPPASSRAVTPAPQTVSSRSSPSLSSSNEESYAEVKVKKEVIGSSSQKGTGKHLEKQAVDGRVGISEGDHRQASDEKLEFHSSGGQHHLHVEKGIPSGPQQPHISIDVSNPKAVTVNTYQPTPPPSTATLTKSQSPTKQSMRTPVFKSAVSPHESPSLSQRSSARTPASAGEPHPSVQEDALPSSTISSPTAPKSHVAVVEPDLAATETPFNTLSQPPLTELASTAGIGSVALVAPLALKNPSPSHSTAAATCDNPSASRSLPSSETKLSADTRLPSRIPKTNSPHRSLLANFEKNNNNNPKKIDPSTLPKSLRSTNLDQDRHQPQQQLKKKSIEIKPFESRLAKVSKIVDMFEKSEATDLKPKEHAAPPPIRQFKLSRVGEEP